MNEALIKDLIKIKMKIAHSVIGSLPGSLGEHAVKAEQTLLKVVNEVTQELMEEKAAKKEEKTLNSISID